VPASAAGRHLAMSMSLGPMPVAAATAPPVKRSRLDAPVRMNSGSDGMFSINIVVETQPWIERGTRAQSRRQGWEGN
jgi:hypothetical protein